MLSYTLISLLLNTIIGYVMAILLTGRVVGSKSRGIYSRVKDDFYRIHHYQLGLILIVVGLIYYVVTLLILPSLILSGIVIAGLGVGIVFHDAADLKDRLIARQYKYPEDKGILKKTKIYG